MNSYDLTLTDFFFSLSISHSDLFSRFLVNVLTDQQWDLTLYNNNIIVFKWIVWKSVHDQTFVLNKQ